MGGPPVGPEVTEPGLLGQVPAYEADDGGDLLAAKAVAAAGSRARALDLGETSREAAPRRAAPVLGGVIRLPRRRQDTASIP